MLDRWFCMEGKVNVEFYSAVNLNVFKENSHLKKVYIVLQRGLFFVSYQLIRLALRALVASSVVGKRSRHEC